MCDATKFINVTAAGPTYIIFQTIYRYIKKPRNMRGFSWLKFCMDNVWEHIPPGWPVVMNVVAPETEVVPDAFVP